MSPRKRDDPGGGVNGRRKTKEAASGHAGRQRQGRGRLGGYGE